MICVGKQKNFDEILGFHSGTKEDLFIVGCYGVTVKYILKIRRTVMHQSFRLRWKYYTPLYRQ
jgi:hypothetical protein